MVQHETYQIHANVNVAHGDARLRVTVTMYDDLGNSYAHKTWRHHTVPLSVDGLEWIAYSGVVELARMMATACRTDLATIEEPDEALPGL